MTRLALIAAFAAALGTAAGAQTIIVDESDRNRSQAQAGAVSQTSAYVTTTTTVRRTVGSPVEVRSIDPAARTIVVRSDGKDQAFVIDEAGLDFDALAPGQQVLLSWRFNRDGKPEAIIRVTPAGAFKTNAAAVARTEVVRAAGPFEVIATDPAEGTLTIREGGKSRTVLVDQLALVGLPDLRPGDDVLLSWGGDRVIVITKQ